ncbi:MAG: aldo/keto reductase [Hyphomicrobiaceae bacterium]
MEKRKLGRTGINVSVLSFGCGAVGGLMTKGDAKDQERAVARALELGINYLDTASIYGDGTSEVNLGRVLKSLKPKALIATKFRLKDPDYATIGASITASLEASLKRLGQSSVDLFQLHNRIGSKTGGDMMSTEDVLGQVVPALEALKKAGKIRFFGITALGETAALHSVVSAGKFDTAQICYNALQPSAGRDVPKGYPGQDYQRLMTRAHEKGMGTIGIRVLAGGALSGSEVRHPLNMQVVEPIGSGESFAVDARRARSFEPMISEGFVSSLPELALRFSISDPALSCTLVGLATLDELEAAVKAVMKGPLSTAGLARLAALQKAFV